MTLRLRPDPGTVSVWRAFWELAEGRLINDALKTDRAMGTLAPFMAEHPAGLIVAATDAVADTVVEWADELGKNPACIAETAFNMLHSQLQPPERLVLLAASQTLLAQDPTGEAGSPHQVCHPWPADAAVTSLATVGGGEVLRQALTAASQTHGMEQQPVPALINAVPGVLTNILWGRSKADPDRMRDLIDIKLAMA
ncbi:MULTISPECIES: hypothetical protein [Actinoplanes]|uniref:hypothetical protein n=1 Tax=Actinoplanes TaxID=1865 RepID=UPI000ABA1E56|nr:MULTISPECIES: hypothetical protein [Actinoplanes]GLY06930.1 hypothetical protein Acsp01_73090 [Actinoplanes sp. NBRC 101535]